MTAAIRVVRRGLAPTLAALAGAALTAWPAAAQSPRGLAIYSADEVSSGGVQLFLLGASLARHGAGLGPVLDAQGYLLAFPGTSVWAMTPSVGLRGGYDGGELQGRIGYTFVNRSLEGSPQGAVAPGGNRSGLTVTGRLDQRGTAQVRGQAIATYNIGARMLWSRGRLSTSIARPTPGTTIRLGGEATFLNASRPGYAAWEVGPTLEYDRPRFVGTLSAGPKVQNPGSTAAYLHLDLVFRQ